MIGADAQGPQVRKAQIDNVINAIVESWNTHDMKLHAAQFTDDADFVNVLGMYWKGRAEIEQHHAAIHSTIFRNSKLRILEHSVRELSDTVALAHVRWEMTGHDAIPGVNFTEVRRGIGTVVLVEQGGQWLISAFQNTDIVPVPALPTNP